MRAGRKLLALGALMSVSIPGATALASSERETTTFPSYLDVAEVDYSEGAKTASATGLVGSDFIGGDFACFHRTVKLRAFVDGKQVAFGPYITDKSSRNGGWTVQAFLFQPVDSISIVVPKKTFRIRGKRYACSRVSQVVFSQEADSP